MCFSLELICHPLPLLFFSLLKTSFLFLSVSLSRPWTRPPVSLFLPLRFGFYLAIPEYPFPIACFPLRSYNISWSILLPILRFLVPPFLLLRLYYIPLLPVRRSSCLPASLSFLNAAEISLVEKQYHAKTTSAFINVRLLAVRTYTLIASLCSMS